MLVGVEGISNFAALHLRDHDDEVQLPSTSWLPMARDLRSLPLQLRRQSRS
jgi:hypothetical protein